jgi:hypothetical protein
MDPVDPVDPVDPMEPVEPVDPTDPRGAAIAFFNANVQPILQAKCSTVDACHGGTSVSPIKFCPPVAANYHSVVTSYAAQLTGYNVKENAPLIQYVVPGPHSGVTYTAAEITKIGDWLDMELAANADPMNPNPNPTGPGPGQVSEQLIQEWSGCMDLNDWNQTGVAQAWAGKGSGEGPCIRCHINGQASFIATDESERMFNVVASNRYFMQSYFSPDVTDLANAAMKVNRPGLERPGINAFPHTEHPSYNVEGEALDKLIEFYNLTMARKVAGTCGLPRIMPQ